MSYLATPTFTGPLPGAESFTSFCSTDAPTSCASISALVTHEPRPVDVFGPVPHYIYFPKEHAPTGSRYCEEIDAFVPEHLPYRIRGLKKATSKWPWTKLVYRIRYGHKYENLVMAMGITHGSIELISLREAQGRPDIVYRSVAHLDLVAAN